MAKILAKKWKDTKTRRTTGALSVEDWRKLKASKKARAQDHRQKADEMRERRREYFRMLREKKECRDKKKGE